MKPGYTRINIYIDNSNIFNGFRKYNIKADYEKLKVILSRGRRLNEIILYEGLFYPTNPNKLKWYADLKNNSGYRVETSFDKRTSNSTIEKKIDVKIAIDIISHAYENVYNTAVLVSGDGDFLPVIKKIEELDKNIEVWAFKYSLANVIREEMKDDRLFFIDDYLNDLKI